MYNKSILFLAIFFAVSLVPILPIEASSNTNLFVSAENPVFDNHFSGSMVIEVVVNDNNLRNTDEGEGEPDVTINGKILRMVQATDGQWYAYFANLDYAKIADSTVGSSGEGLDFGVFCDKNTESTVFGISLSDTDGFAVPRSGGLTGFTDGNNSPSQCTGNPTSSTNLNNVVRKAKSINTNPNIPSGQIGLDVDAWPLVQLYSFDDVIIQYNAGGNVQRVDLEFDEIPNIAMSVDRDTFPQNAQVFLSVNDFQLNQDPTDEDSWTFNVVSPLQTFYQAFDNSGANSANGGAGLKNLIPNLSNFGFEDNGQLSVDLGSVAELTSNANQPTTTVSDGTTNFSNIITLVESGPNTGIFESFDDNDQSIVKILGNAPRGQIAKIDYNQKAMSILTGFSTASVTLNEKPSISVSSASLIPGTESLVTLFDPDQNLNSGAQDDLDVFRSTAIIPTLTIGNPITLEKSSDVKFYSTSIDILTGASLNPTSSVPDTNSDRLVIDTRTIGNGGFDKISFALGISASTLLSSLLDTNLTNTQGTNWLNYDLRSFEQELALTNFNDTEISLYFGNLGDTTPITIVDSGDLSSSSGFVQLDDSDIQAISAKTGSVFVVMNFDSSNSPLSVATVSNETMPQPIIFDFFSFGLINDDEINNSIYRLELKETSDNSSTFSGTIEYAVTNQLNIFDPSFIQTVRTIGDEIQFIVTGRLIDDAGISISYSDFDEVGVSITTSTKSDIQTSSGTITTSSSTFRFGHPVTFTLKDPDLNLKNDNIDIYLTINDPNSPNVDTVGKDANILLEILIKDIRYKRCTINGIEHGGLASTGFTLVETGPSTGIFEGVFKMPSQICNKSGTKLISAAGGSLDAKYYDSRDSSGNNNIFRLSDSKKQSFSSPPKLNTNEIFLPNGNDVKEIILSGNIESSKRGIPLIISLIYPDGKKQNFSAEVSNNGSYRSIFSIKADSLIGTYAIQLSYNTDYLGSVSFNVSSQGIPDWIKNNAKWWSSTSISDSEFIDGLEYLIEEKILVISPTERSKISERTIPDWIKNNARWWTSDQISDDEFLNSIQYLVNKGIILI